MIKQQSYFRVEDIQEIAGQIERYLTKHPKASDSLPGILCWWLPRQRFEESATKVVQALELLVERGTVSKRITMDGNSIFSAQSCAPGDKNDKHGSAV